jgi:carboxyl-terminal processing protease
MRRLPITGLALTLALSFGIACGSKPATPTQPSSIAAPVATSTISAAASTYLTRIIDIAVANSINRSTINWTTFRSSVIESAGSAQTIADLSPAIRTAITLLHDGHSSYRSASGSTIFVPLRSCVPPAAVPLSLPPNIGSVRVGAFSGTVEQANAFARQIQDSIAAADRDDLIGWIVDLRSNGGGNMWPMVAGLGPILGEGPLGYFIGPTGTETLWEYRNGASTSGGTALTTVIPAYALKRQQPRVAVLSDIGIASSGEATLIAFKQRANTRSFGQGTCGLSTANSTFTLSDGALFNITSAVMADRVKTRYGESVAPDEAISDPAQTIQRAIEWLQTGR